jgi:DNA-binding response OmpR family regulator
MKGKLLAGERLKTLFKRYSGELDVVQVVINRHPVRLDYRQHRAWIDEQEIDLTAREMYLFERLAQTPNRVVSIADMVEATHGLSLDGREASQLVRPLIRTLRRKLSQHLDQHPCIKNVRSRSYLLLTDLPQAPLEAPQRLE